MRNRQEQAADELRKLNQAELEAVSGAMVVDMGVLGEWKVRPNCIVVTWPDYKYMYCKE